VECDAPATPTIARRDYAALPFPHALRNKEHDSDDHNAVTGRTDMVAACGVWGARPAQYAKHVHDGENTLSGAGLPALSNMKL
jgi:hypothetical protein